MPNAVNILMSTYNGEKFLQEQLDSLTAQTHTTHHPLHITIRDDGSTDNTPSILKKFQVENKNCTLVIGKNLGLPWSFFELMNLADDNFSYYAFCDQDDVWLPNKLEKAIEKLAPTPEPALYCSRQNYIDEQGKKIGESFTPLKPITPENAWFENLAVGCSIVINKPLLELGKIERFEGIFMHDWWAYQIAHCTGTVYFDNNAYINYRQHSNNQVGGNLSLIQKTKQRYKKFKEIKNGKQVSPRRQLIALAKKLEEESLDKPNSLQKINEARSFCQRLQLIQNNKYIYRQKTGEDILWKLLFLVNML